MKRLLILSVFVLAAVGQEVKHAPTVAQCQADQQLWMSKVEGPSSQLPEYNVLVGWVSEMGDCGTIDPNNRFKYFNIEAEVTAEQQIRLSHFLDRHDMWQKFLAEDAAGKR